MSGTIFRHARVLTMDAGNREFASIDVRVEGRQRSRRSATIFPRQRRTESSTPRVSY